MTPDIQPAEVLQEYQRLIGLMRDLASTLDLSELLDRIVHAAADLTKAEAASILLFDPIQQQLYFQAATNLTEPMLRGLVVPMDSLAGWILLNRQPLTIADVATDSRHFNKIGQRTKLETRSLVGVPMINKDKVVGVLEAINKTEDTFTLQDEEMLSILGAQAAVAIENARLFQQSDLVADFVHELRTPLASLNTAAHLLVRPELSEDQRQSMSQTIYNETLRLMEMSSTFLDFARLDSGRARFDMTTFDIPPLMRECIQLMQVRADEKRQNLTASIPHDLPSMRGDRAKLRQVLINLLSNAIKYTPSQGSIHLSAIQENGWLALSVSDTGSGIPAEAIDHLFERFYRVPGSEALSQGTGLGLSITKKIVEAHSGHIEVESEYGVGTIFRVFVPFSRPSSQVPLEPPKD